MNYRVVLGNIEKVLKNFIPVLKTNIVKQQVSHDNVLAIMKEMKKINYRLDRLRSDLKLAKDNRVMSEKELKEKIDVRNSSRTDNGCAESDK